MMLLSRRGFFGLLGAAVAVEVIAPKIYVFAPQGGWDNRADYAEPDNWTSVPINEAAVEAIELEAWAHEIPNLIVERYNNVQARLINPRFKRIPFQLPRKYLNLPVRDFRKGAR